MRRMAPRGDPLRTFLASCLFVAILSAFPATTAAPPAPGPYASNWGYLSVAGHGGHDDTHIVASDRPEFTPGGFVDADVLVADPDNVFADPVVAHHYLFGPDGSLVAGPIDSACDAHWDGGILGGQEVDCDSARFQLPCGVTGTYSYAVSLTWGATTAFIRDEGEDFESFEVARSTVAIGGRDDPVCPNQPATLASSCVPGPLAIKDFDGDGVAAFYARSGAVRLNEFFTIGLAPAGAWCWVAGDVDDDGAQRLPDSPVEVPETTACGPDPSSTFAPKDLDGDGVPALYTNSGKSSDYTVHEDGSVSASKHAGLCWITGDADDDGVTRVPV
ncbi:MAG: hypothetical protein ACYC2H_06715 [Thermoplasmatota archaeon]